MKRLASFQKVRTLPGVDHDDTLAMLDGPCVGRQPIGPVAIGKHSKPARQSVSAPFNLRCLDPDEACLDGVYFHAQNFVLCGYPEVSERYARENTINQKLFPQGSLARAIEPAILFA